IPPHAEPPASATGVRSRWAVSVTSPVVAVTWAPPSIRACKVSGWFGLPALTAIAPAAPATTPPAPAAAFAGMALGPGEAAGALTLGAVTTALLVTRATVLPPA